MRIVFNRAALGMSARTETLLRLSSMHGFGGWHRKDRTDPWLFAERGKICIGGFHLSVSQGILRRL